VELPPLWTRLRLSLSAHFGRLCILLDALQHSSASPHGLPRSSAGTGSADIDTDPRTVHAAAAACLDTIDLLHFCFDFLNFTPDLSSCAADIPPVSLSTCYTLEDAQPASPADSSTSHPPVGAFAFFSTAAADSAAVLKDGRVRHFPALFLQLLDVLYKFAGWRRYSWMISALNFLSKLSQKLYVNRSDVSLPPAVMQALVTNFQLLAPVPVWLTPSSSSASASAAASPLPALEWPVRLHRPPTSFLRSLPSTWCALEGDTVAEYRVHHHSEQYDQGTSDEVVVRALSLAVSLFNSMLCTELPTPAPSSADGPQAAVAIAQVPLPAGRTARSGSRLSLSVSPALLGASAVSGGDAGWQDVGAMCYDKPSSDHAGGSAAGMHMHVVPATSAVLHGHTAAGL